MGRWRWTDGHGHLAKSLRRSQPESTLLVKVFINNIWGITMMKMIRTAVFLFIATQIGMAYTLYAADTNCFRLSMKECHATPGCFYSCSGCRSIVDAQPETTSLSVDWANLADPTADVTMPQQHIRSSNTSSKR